MAVLQNRVTTIEKERKEEKDAAEAARRAALGLPPEEPNPMASFNQLHLDLGELVKFVLWSSCLHLHKFKIPHAYIEDR